MKDGFDLPDKNPIKHEPGWLNEIFNNPDGTREVIPPITTPMKKLTPSEAGAALGRLSAGKPKHYTPEELQRRAELARGLAARRQSKPVKTRHVVIDRAGRKWPYLAENVQDAIFLAKADGINAVGAKEERE